jgi:hypothetical protein
MPDELFDTDALFVAPAPDPLGGLSPDRRRTRRQSDLIASGRHPLTGGPVHADAPHDGTRTTPGLRCGDCRWRQNVEHSARPYPKCVVHNGARVTARAASDVRAWWPACPAHEPREAAGDA